MWVWHGPHLSSGSNTKCFSRVISRPPLQEMLTSSSAHKKQWDESGGPQDATAVQLSRPFWSRAPEQRGRLRHSSNMNRLQKTPFFIFFGGGSIACFCILQPNPLGFLYEEVKLERGNCFFYTTQGKASWFFSVYWSIARSFHHSCNFSIRGFIFRFQFVVPVLLPDFDLWHLLGDSGASSPSCVTSRGSFQCPISPLAYRCFAERLLRRHVSAVAFLAFNSSVRTEEFLCQFCPSSCWWFQQNAQCLKPAVDCFPPAVVIVCQSLMFYAVVVRLLFLG